MFELFYVTSATSALNAIVAHGADVNERNKKGQTPLHVCRDESIASVLLEKGADVNAKDDLGLTPLQYYSDPSKSNMRSKNSTKKAIELLVEHGADLNAVDNRGMTPIETCGDPEISEHLLKLGADVNARDENGRTPLHRSSDLSFVRLLIKNGADVNARDNDVMTPLHVCTDSEKAEVLVSNGADINARDIHGQTPLHTCHGVKLVMCLLKLGADLDVHNRDYLTPLGSCTDSVKAELLRIFSACKESANKGNKCGKKLFSAKTAESVLECIAQGEQVDERNEEEQTPLHVCANAEVAKALLDNGADVNARDIYGQTPLFARKNMDIAKVLLEHGANPNVRVKLRDVLLRVMVDRLKEDGDLDEAARALVDRKFWKEDHEWEDDDLEEFRTNYKHLYIWLLKNDTFNEIFKDKDINQEFFLTPLHRFEPCCWADDDCPENYDAFRYFELDKRDEELNDGYQQHPRYYKASYYFIDYPVNGYNYLGLSVIRYANEDYLRLLIEHGADITTTDYFGRTMLHYTTNAEFAEFLFQRCEAAGIKQEYYANIPDKYGVTALHFASAGKDTELVSCLIRHGADVNATDDVGLTPLHRCKKVDIAKILVAHGADVNAIVDPNNLVLDFEECYDYFESGKMQVTEYVCHNYEHYNGYTSASRESKSQAFVEFIEGCDGFVPLKDDDEDEFDEDDE
ncbi:MAG: ankyrin repeat domain-containing protein [Proteobacteria bacterium]|nr:ankyrin repeat domain-containing protein [Pseudomonadota bacterium]